MTEQEPYDIVIVGAGPAGLSAARTAARLGFRTLVVERLAGPGEVGHSCSAALVPAPGIVAGKPLMGGLFFPQIDLWIPESLIKAKDIAQHCVSPGGLEFQTVFTQDNGDALVTLIDKSGLLRMMAEQAASRGAEFRYNTEVTGLLREGDRVCGVTTREGDIRGEIVLSGEGSSRNLCEQAGLYRQASRRHSLVITQDLSAPAVRSEHLGRMVTLGACGEGLPAGHGSVVFDAPGHATVTYTMQVDHLDCAMADLAAIHLAACLRDPRLAEALAGAQPLTQSCHSAPLQESPARVVSDGFIGMGDAITPGGHLGILPSMFLARQAVLIAAEALDSGEVAAADLLPYDQLYSALILPQLEAEAKTTVALTQLRDDELDRLCQLLNWLHLPIPFAGYQRSVDWETVATLVRQCELAPADWNLLQRVLPDGKKASAVPEGFPSMMPVPCDTSTALF